MRYNMKTYRQIDVLFVSIRNAVAIMKKHGKNG